MFLGKFYHRVDEKGRIALPARFRAEFAGGVVLVPSFDRCINVFPMKMWEKISADFAPDPLSPSSERKIGRYIYGESSSTELDTQGRIPLPLEQRQRLNIKEEVVVVGVNNYLEIWDKDSWEKERAEVMGEAGKLLENAQKKGIAKKEQ